jgi:hypothetical protein
LEETQQEGTLADGKSGCHAFSIVYFELDINPWFGTIVPRFLGPGDPPCAIP